MTTDEEIIKIYTEIELNGFYNAQAAIRLYRVALEEGRKEAQLRPPTPAGVSGRMAEKDTERKLLLKFAKSSPSGATSAPENAKKKGDKR
jgi:hypothetical protein